MLEIGFNVVVMIFMTEHMLNVVCILSLFISISCLLCLANE